MPSELVALNADVVGYSALIADDLASMTDTMRSVMLYGEHTGKFLRGGGTGPGESFDAAYGPDTDVTISTGPSAACMTHLTALVPPRAKKVLCSNLCLKAPPRELDTARGRVVSAGEGTITRGRCMAPPYRSIDLLLPEHGLAELRIEGVAGEANPSVQRLCSDIPLEYLQCDLATPALAGKLGQPRE